MISWDGHPIYLNRFISATTYYKYVQICISKTQQYNGW